MGQETDTEQQHESPSTTIAGQGQPGTGPGQLDQEPQHQSERGLQPIPGRKEDNEKESDAVEQAEQNKSPNDRDHNETDRHSG
jgi:hypothetical protein